MTTNQGPRSTRLKPCALYIYMLSKNLKFRICKTIVLRIVPYGCEIWSLVLREAHKLRMFENRVLRRILGWKWDEVTGRWRQLHNEELQDLY
jgi:hypothetical protein